MIKISEKGVSVTLKISPNASKNEIIKNQGELKVKITAQPIENKANKALIEFLAKQFKVPKTSIEIIRGETSKEKTLLIKVFDSDKIDFVTKVLSDGVNRDDNN